MRSPRTQEYARLFSNLSLVMCAYGGAYALWSLPSSMTLTNMAASLLPSRKTRTTSA